MSTTKNIGYLAPLNYDRYFKKVFSDLKIAKRFLEDFLDIEIQEIEIKPTERYLTDDAKFVKFDFRCKIDDNFIIIEMQQWYKPDIVQRFYLYDALNTGLQLEELGTKTIILPNNQLKEIKDYRNLLPTITIIWLVADNLNIDKDYISFVPSPEELLTFIRDVNVWRKPDLDKIIEEREKLLSLINNKTKNIDFLQSNRLIFAFQKNIVENKRYKKYFAWFALAQKTLKRVSDKLEFSEYEEDEVLKEVVRRLKKQLDDPEEIKYIEDRSEFIEQVQRYEDGVKHYAFIEVEQEMEKVKQEVEKAKQEVEKVKQEAEREKQEVEQAANKKIEQAELKSKVLLLYYAQKKSVEEIATITNESENTIKSLITNKG